jgi:hypothetical protein
MRTQWHVAHLYLVAANTSDQDGQLWFRDGYAVGIQAMTGRASSANAFLAFLRANGWEGAPEHIVTMWKETLDASGAVLPRRETVYQTPGMANLPIVPASSVTGKYIAPGTGLAGVSPSWVPS